MLRATTACTFCTSQLPKVVRQWCVLYILTWKCASRHNGVHFLHISTSKGAPDLRLFVHFHISCWLIMLIFTNIFLLVESIIYIYIYICVYVHIYICPILSPLYFNYQYQYPTISQLYSRDIPMVSPLKTHKIPLRVTTNHDNMSWNHCNSDKVGYNLHETVDLPFLPPAINLHLVRKFLS